MGPGNDDQRLNSPASYLAPMWRRDQRYGTCARARIRAQTPQIPCPNWDGLLTKRLWDQTKDEWTPGYHSTRQNFEKQHKEQPHTITRSILHSTQNLGKRGSKKIIPWGECQPFFHPRPALFAGGWWPRLAGRSVQVSMFLSQPDSRSSPWVAILQPDRSEPIPGQSGT